MCPAIGTRSCVWMCARVYLRNAPTTFLWYLFMYTLAPFVSTRLTQPRAHAYICMYVGQAGSRLDPAPRGSAHGPRRCGGGEDFWGLKA